MAGRGRGRGNTSSLTYEQTQALGITRGDINQPSIILPPPLYPKLENKPLPLIQDARTEYMLIVKRQFIEYLNDSPAFVQPDVAKTDIERYSDKYKILSVDSKHSKYNASYEEYLPNELRLNPIKKIEKARKRKLSRTVEMETKFKKLEEEEKTLKEEPNVEETIKQSISDDEEEKDSDKEEVEDPDEEMDDGTDYVDNYFDNGEALDDEDDNIDDGPVY